MSLQVDNYIIVGINIIEDMQKMEEEDFLNLYEKVENSNKLDIVYNSEYCIIGKILKHTKELDTQEVFKLNHNELKVITLEVTQELNKIVNKEYDTDLFIFQHTE